MGGAIGRFGTSVPRVVGATRTLAGCLLACHGAQKLLLVVAGLPPGALATEVWAAGLIELVAGAVVARPWTVGG
jgi:hypothetical protein